MKTDNELIADFMGIEVQQYPTHFGEVTAIVPKEGIIDWPVLNVYSPDKDWNHLMSVVNHIGDIVAETQDYVLCQKAADSIDLPIIGTHIGEVYRSVVEFIRWYNDYREG